MKNITVVYMLLTVLGGLLLLALLDYVYTGRLRDVVELVIILGTAAAVLVGLRHTRRCWVYFCVGDRLMIRRKDGHAERVVLDLPFHSLRALLPPGDPAREGYRELRDCRNYGGSPGRKNKPMLIWQLKGSYFRCCMEPDGKLREMLEKAIEENCRRDKESCGHHHRTRGQVRQPEDGEQ